MKQEKTYTLCVSGPELAMLRTAIEAYIDEQPDRDDLAVLLSKLDNAQ